ncbi:MAG TPA: 6,7-dimethyl-8-ribityllumazine synthase [Tepidisphaeraceae bacterium]|nr:6,7-dimethyl-8-ribityllumazine synthase [Tepidisphaeraceae bacterium]
MSRTPPRTVSMTLPKNARFAVVASRFNGPIVDSLLTGCVRRLEALGVQPDRIETHRVPGAFELPLAAKALARAGRFSAIVCLGTVIRGDTPHFDYVAGEAARGIQDVSLAENLPVIFGVLTTETEEQARQRAGGAHGNAGERAADAAVEMAVLMAKVRG